MLYRGSPLLRVLCLLLVLTGCQPSGPGSAMTGRVVDVDGHPVPGASVSALKEQTTTDQEGWFQLPSAGGPRWVTVEHPGFLSRTRAGSVEQPLLVRLSPDDGETISLHFVGDSMFGRRFYDPNEDGDSSDGLLHPGEGADAHLELLAPVSPLLSNAHLTIANLETPLVPDPYIDPARSRPPRFHPTKDLVFASDPSAALALRQAGVDLVDLGNNHFYDGLEAGVGSTLAALEQAGYGAGAGHFGGGASAAEAWQPAVATAAGQTVAFLGCTSVTGEEHAVSFVASADKGGAARCDEQLIRAAVTEARARYDIVVFMIHGGYEYSRAPSESVREMTMVAREAGATLVINHHPHVVGGFDWNGSSLVAWSLGNFVFDQTVWPTFESYLVAVHLRRGQVVRAYIEPLMIENYVPRGVTGGLADFVARGAAGREPGAFLVEDGAMEIDLHGDSARQELALPLDGDPEMRSIFQLDRGWWLSGSTGSVQVRSGRDLLWAGSFEHETIDEQRRHLTLWDLGTDDHRGAGVESAYEGKAGVRLQRNSHNEADAVLTPSHRILVDPGTELSVVGMVRASGAAGLIGAKSDVKVQLSWYGDTIGPSEDQETRPLSIAAENEWAPFRFDVTVPPRSVAMGLFLRLEAPERGSATADFDDIRVVAWAPAGTSFSPLFDHFWVVGSGGEAIISRVTLPGAEALAGRDETRRPPARARW